MHHLILAVLHLVFAEMPLSGGKTDDPFLHDSAIRAVAIDFFDDENEGDTVLTEWTDSRRHQVNFDRMGARRFITVMAEGKNEEGKSLYRTGHKPRASVPDGIKIESWWCRTGEDVPTFLVTNRAREKAGQHLVKFQSFVDAKGVIRCQALWAKIEREEKEQAEEDS